MIHFELTLFVLNCANVSGRQSPHTHTYIHTLTMSLHRFILLDYHLVIDMLCKHSYNIKFISDSYNDKTVKYMAIMLI